MRIGDIVLPVELECAVFEAAAFLDYKNVPRLLLVARRVHTWLEPFYCVLVCRGSAIPRRLWSICNGKTSAGSTDFVQRHVRHILFTDNSPTSKKPSASALEPPIWHFILTSGGRSQPTSAISVLID
ncbi:hypothetical protein C8J57DRAFT_1494973 [Mycena rebaudengoi]|nr:hypothetical protein C8J57DRAFT_1494973 [Mycena rebaudengoi]